MKPPLLCRWTARPSRVLLALALTLTIPAGALAQNLQVPAPAHVPIGRVDATPGPQEVNPNTGAYSPTISLDVLPAAGGLAPDLDVVYSHGEANGLLGAGWSLGFVSKIALRSARRGVPIIGDEDNILLLDGQRLHPIGDSGALGKEKDDKTVFTAIYGGFPDVHVIGWRGTRDGVTTVWGLPSSDQVDQVEGRIEYRDNARTQPTAWLISSVTDPFGNRIEYTWRESAGFHRPHAIRYGFTAEDSYQRIRFSYEGRPDPRESYADGQRRVLDVRLSGVDVETVRGGDVTLTHRYAFDYAPAAYDVQSLLRAVRQVGTNGLEELVLAELDYSDELSAWSEPVAEDEHADKHLHFDADLFPEVDPDDDTPPRTRMLVDHVDPGGRVDVIAFQSNCHLEPQGDFPPRLECGPSHAVFRQAPAGQACGDGGGADSCFNLDETRSDQLNDLLGPIHSNGTGEPIPFQMIDLDGDGYLDVVKGDATQGDPANYAYGDIDRAVILGSSAGWQQVVTPNWLGEGALDGADALEDFHFADLNADGLPDLVGRSSAYLNTGESPFFKVNESIPLWIPLPVDPQLDPACMTHDDTGMVVAETLGTWGEALAYHPKPEHARPIDASEWIWQHTTHADFNGDGITDRRIAYPRLKEEGDVWVRDDATCPMFTRLMLGDGLGGFRDAGYDLGGLGSREPAYTNEELVVQGDQQPVPVLYTYAIHHLGISDLDGNGRPDVSQYCEMPDGRMVLAGLLHHGLDLGFGLGDAEECPALHIGEYLNQIPRTLPTAFIGQAPLDEVYATWADLDNDGLSDLFVGPNIHSGSDYPQFGGDGPVVFRNARSAPQNRLVGITGPYGGRRSLTWTTSAAAANPELPTSVPVIGSVEGAGGLTSYVFEDGGMSDDGRFLGFRRVVIQHPTDARTVKTFSTGAPFVGSPLTESLFDADGDLTRVKAMVYGNADAGGFNVDAVAPYFNPLFRVCEFEFGDGANAEETTPEGLESACAFFGGESFPEPEPDDSSIPYNPWGHVPWDDAQDVLQPIIVALMHGPNQEYAQYGAQSEPAERRRSMNDGGEARLYVTEIVTDADSGKPLEIRDYRDVLKRGDTTTTTMSWAFDPTWGTYNLLTSEEIDAYGALGEAFTYGEHVGGRWESKVQHGAEGDRLKLRKIDPSTGQIVQETRWNAISAVTYVYDACGGVELETSETGSWKRTHRDERCRVAWTETSEELRIEYAHDALGRRTWRLVTTTSADPPATWQDRETFYDDLVGPDRVFDGGHDLPTTIRIVSERDGTETLRLGYVDRWGREVKTVTCERDGGSYGCKDLAQALTTLKTWDDFGRVEAESEPFFDPRRDPATVHQTAYDYDALGRETARTRPDSTVVTTAYGLDREAKTDPNGVVTLRFEDTTDTWVWIDEVPRGHTGRDAFGQVVEVEDAAGATTDYSYDTFGRLVEARDPAVPVVDGGGGFVTTYTRPTRRWAYTANDEVWKAWDRNGHLRTYSYDLRGRLLQTRGPDDQTLELRHYPDLDELAFGERRVEIEDDRGNLSVRWLDPAGEVWKVRASDGTETLTYRDQRGRVERVVRPWGQEEVTEYDRFGRPIATELQAGGLVMRTETDRTASGLVSEVREPGLEGRVVRHDHDAMGRLVRTRVGANEGTAKETLWRSYDLAGRVIAQREAGVLTRFEYDTLGRVVVERVAAEAVGPGLWEQNELYERLYDAADRLTGQLNAAGEVKQWTYDAMGRLSEEAITGADGSTVSLATHGYDAAGNRTRVTDGEGVTTWTEYDALHRVSAVTPGGLGTTLTSYALNPPHPVTGLPTGDLAVTTLAPEGELSVTHIDGEGRSYLSVGADLVVTQQVFEDGRLVRTEQYAPGEDVPRRVKVVSYHAQTTRVADDWDWMDAEWVQPCLGGDPHCPVGKVSTTWTPSGEVETVADASGMVRTYARREDGTGLLEAVTGGPQDVRYVYDPDYPLIAEIEGGPEGAAIVTSVTRERNQRISEVRRVHDSGGQPQELTTFGYDDAGRRSLASFALGSDPEDANTITTTWDAAGRVRMKRVDIGTQMSAIARWTWAKNGALTSVKYPLSARRVEYLYDFPSSSKLAEIRLVHSGKTIADDFVFDDNGRLTELKVAHEGTSDVWLIRGFSDAGREEWREVSGLGSPMGTRMEHYSYDDLGRLSGEAIHETDWDTPDREHVWGYDAAGRGYLAFEERSELGVTTFSATYAYDAAGRRESINDGPGGTYYEYGDDYRLDEIDGQAILWDDHGRQISDAANRTMTWGLANQLREIRDAQGGLLVRNVHDAEGQRILSEIGGETWIFFPGLSSGEVLQRRKAGGDDYEDMVMSPAGTVIAMVDGQGRITPIVKDIKGSPYLFGSEEVQRSGFGVDLGDDVDTGSGLGFHQMWQSGLPGLQMAGVRAYDTTTGRFLTPDPLDLAAAADPNDAIDSYRYAHNSPLQLADPTGYRAGGTSWDRVDFRGGGSRALNGSTMDPEGGANGLYGSSTMMDVKGFSNRLDAYEILDLGGLEASSANMADAMATAAELDELGLPIDSNGVAAANASRELKAALLGNRDLASALDLLDAAEQLVGGTDEGIAAIDAALRNGTTSLASADAALGESLRDARGLDGELLGGPGLFEVEGGKIKVNTEGGSYMLNGPNASPIGMDDKGVTVGYGDLSIAFNPPGGMPSWAATGGNLGALFGQLGTLLGPTSARRLVPFFTAQRSTNALVQIARVKNLVQMGHSVEVAQALTHRAMAQAATAATAEAATAGTAGTATAAGVAAAGWAAGFLVAGVTGAGLGHLGGNWTSGRMKAHWGANAGAVYQRRLGYYSALLPDNAAGRWAATSATGVSFFGQMLAYPPQH